MEIRPGTRADALAIATVHVRSWKAAYRGLLPQPYLDALEPGLRLGQWETFLDATAWPATGALVLADRSSPDDTDAHTGSERANGSPSETGGVCGFAGMSPTRDGDEDPTSVGELQTLYLEPRIWGCGAGSLLLTAVEDQFRSAGFRSASAWVLETNARARRFYERHGWRGDGTTKLHDWDAFVATDVRYRVPLA
ncbi:MAG TPA: GNAT family N-acetyltransferase [Acidimicrobiales bacterium]|nr:GNAT family N-acetyltransferase [Acidimicrobiales bacterium]